MPNSLMRGRRFAALYNFDHPVAAFDNTTDGPTDSVSWYDPSQGFSNLAPGHDGIIISCRFKLPALPGASERDTVLALGSDTLSLVWNRIAIDENGNCQIHNRNGSGTDDYDTIGTVEPNKWYFAAMASVNDNLRIGCLNKAVTSFTSTSSLSNGSDEWRLAVGYIPRSGTTGYLRAHVCDVQYYRSAVGVTETDLTWLAEHPGYLLHERPGSAVSSSALSVAWAMDEGAGNTITDYSGNGNDGTWDSPTVEQWARRGTAFFGYK